MKYFVMIFLFISGSAIAQKIDYNSIILPNTATDVDFAEKLVRLAWSNNPDPAILTHELNSSSLKLKQARRNWLDNLKITGNLNEFNFQSIGDQPNSQAQTVSAFYPRYNVSATLSLGTFFNEPIKARIAKEEVQVAIQNINQQKLALRAEVLSRYQTYLSNKEIFEIRSQILNDSDFPLKEQRFRRNEISLLEYNLALDRNNQQKIDKAEAEKNFHISRIQVEEMIGIKLADVR